MVEQKGEVAALLDRLAAGQITLGEVVTEFAARAWPPGPGRSVDARAAMARGQEDPEPIAPNSWGEVEAAYAAGKIDDQQYAALYYARGNA